MRDIGNVGEDYARGVLERGGYEILARNVTGERGELDFVAREGGYIVYVEVKARRASTGEPPSAAVTRKKMRSISACALEYAVKHGLLNAPQRFDVVEVYLDGPDITHNIIKNAFDYAGRAY